MKNYLKLNYISIFIIVIILAVFVAYRLYPKHDIYNNFEVLTGDTLRLDRSKPIFRLVGIDAPDRRGSYSPVEPLAHRAAQYLESLIDGRDIRIEHDKEKYDKYGRMLGYVFVDDLFVNEMMVKEGLAMTLVIKPNDKYADILQAAEDTAKTERNGIWADPSSFRPPKGNRKFLIKPEDAEKYVWKRVVVRGKLSLSRQSDKVIVLTMGGGFDVVIFKSDLKNFSFFGIDPAHFYVNKSVEVVGKVSLYRDKPQIIIDHPIMIWTDY